MPSTLPGARRFVRDPRTRVLRGTRWEQRVRSGVGPDPSTALWRPAGRDVPLLVLAVLAVAFTCFFARSVLIPIVAAFTLQGLFSPLVRPLERRGFPRAVSALGVLVTVIGISGIGAYYLAGPASDWLSELPRSSEQIASRLRELRAPVERVVQATQQVEDLAATASGDDQLGGEAVLVVEQEASLFDTAFGYVSQISVSVFLMLALLFLLLTNDGAFLHSLQRTLDDTRDRRTVARVILSFQHGLSTYLITVAVINTLLGLAIGLVLWWLGVPNPALWGVMAGLLNFVPYLGTTLGVGIVAFVSLVSFESSAQALLPPLAYFVLSGLEGAVVTPFLVGDRLRLSPVAVFVSVLIWGFVWGIAGALLAVPILLATMLLCVQIPALRPLGELLARDPTPAHAHAARRSAAA